MNIKAFFGLLLYFFILNMQFIEVSALDSYTILGLDQFASDSDIQRKYKKLRSKYRNNRAKKNRIKRAYDNIVVQRTFSSKNRVEIEQQPAPTIAKHVDQSYLYGYKLNNEFDDGRYFKQNFNETQYILDRMKNSEQNKKTARIIIMIGSIFFKLIPCFLIFCFCRNRDRGGSAFNDVLARAGAGYANFGRRRNRL